MTLAEYDDFVAYSRLHFEEGLIRAGFTESAEGWQGTIVHSSGTSAVLIALPTRYPFHPPRVVPVDPGAVAWSWHRDLDGSLCLVAEDDHEGLWWTDSAAFLEHVAAWFEQAAAGWPEDRPDLDLDRYFEPSEDKRLYLYGDLTRYRGEFVRFRPASNNTMRIGVGTKPAKASKCGKYRFAYVADLGDVDVPPRSWDDVSARISPSVDLNRRIRNRSIDLVLLLYRRGTHDGAITLQVWPTVDHGIAVRRLRSGADTSAAKAARAGLLAPELHERRVAIVGVGAVGSFIADMLVRSGVRHLTLVDGDIVMPGNLVRHVVGAAAVGLTKVHAVKQHLLTRDGSVATDIAVIEEQLTTGDEAVRLLSDHHLVVDATADFATTALLNIAAQATGTRIISTTIQNDGTSYRIDLLPPVDDSDPLPPPASHPDKLAADVFEAGCGSPISPTPPYAVAEAAAATVRHAISLLIERPLHPGGEVRSLPTGKL
uniref:HesA/MoeB/ThiF family protein n=1 Tax=Gordonia sp. B7-2 TaxID=3420932 RepID=UPI003D8F2B70